MPCIAEVNEYHLGVALIKPVDDVTVINEWFLTKRVEPREKYALVPFRKESGRELFYCSPFPMKLVIFRKGEDKNEDYIERWHRKRV